VAGCKDLAASRLAAANPSCVGVRLMCNSRERETAQNKMAARLRPAKASAIRREALPVAEGKAISTARLRPVPDESIIRETGQLLVAPLIFRSGCLRSRALHF